VAPSLLHCYTATEAFRCVLWSLQVLALRTEVVELVARLRPADAAAMLKWCTLLRLADDTGELAQPDAINSINYSYPVLQHSSHCAVK
jgi:hypothetical protein